jgi:hypothetical protein
MEPGPVGCWPFTGPSQVMVLSLSSPWTVPEVGEVVSPGAAETSASNVQVVPEPAAPAGMPVAVKVVIELTARASSTRRLATVIGRFGMVFPSLV